MSTLHSRLPDAGSNGPGIHSSSEGSVCGDPKLSAIFKICVRPICHTNEYTSVRKFPFLEMIRRISFVRGHTSSKDTPGSPRGRLEIFVIGS